MEINFPDASMVLIGLISPGDNRTWITVARDHRVHPFVVYHVGVDNSCEHGDYFINRNAALDRMIARARRSMATV